MRAFRCKLLVLFQTAAPVIWPSAQSQHVYNWYIYWIWTQELCSLHFWRIYCRFGRQNWSRMESPAPKVQSITDLDMIWECHRIQSYFWIWVAMLMCVLAYFFITINKLGNEEQETGSACSCHPTDQRWSNHWRQALNWVQILNTWLFEWGLEIQPEGSNLRLYLRLRIRDWNILLKFGLHTWTHTYTGFIEKIRYCLSWSPCTGWELQSSLASICIHLPYIVIETEFLCIYPWSTYMKEQLVTF